MGLVKFGQQTLNIDVVPDGHIIIPESEYLNYKNLHNSYLALKSKIPPVVDDNSLPQVLEKGLRYDDISNKIKSYEEQVKSYEEKLKNYSNIPQDFNVEKWNEYVKREKSEIRNKKIKELTDKVYAKVRDEFGVSYEVDERFIPKDILDTFDPDKPDAFDTWYKVLDSAHTEQQNFLQRMLNNTPQTGKPQVNEQETKMKHPKDVVTDSKISVGKFT